MKKGIVVKELVSWILLVIGLVVAILVILFLSEQGRFYLNKIVEYVTFGSAVL